MALFIPGVLTYSLISRVPFARSITALSLKSTPKQRYASANAAHPSFFVAKYLASRGYRVFAINPGMAGGTIGDVPVFARLADVPEPIDMVDIFRNSEAAGAVVDEALALAPLPAVIWMQLVVRNDAAAARAQARGARVIMDGCPKIEFGRLSGDIGLSGVNSRILSSRRPVMAGSGVQRRCLGNA